MCPVTTDARGAATTTNHAEHVREHGWASVPDLGVTPPTSPRCGPSSTG